MFSYEFSTIFQNNYFLEHPEMAPFQNHEHESMQIMDGEHKLILSTKKMALVVKRDLYCLMKRSYI